MKIVNRFLTGIIIGGVVNGLLWGGLGVIVLAFQGELEKDLQNGWILSVFLSFMFYGGFCGAIIGFFVSLINAGKTISAIGGGLAAFFIIIFINIFDGSPGKNLTLIDLTLMPLIISFLTAFSCYLIVTVLNKR